MSDTDLVAGDGEAARLVSVHPGRRVAARRLPANRALRDARSHLGRRGRAPVRRLGHDRADLGSAARPQSRPGPRRGSAGRPGRGRVLVRARTRGAPTSWPSSSRSARHEVRDLLRAPAPAAVAGGRRVPPDAGRARAGRAGRPARLRRRLGGRAPLPGGVQPLLCPRGLPRRVQPTDQGHPARPRHHSDRARLQPSRPHGGARRHPRPHLGRPGRVRLRGVGVRGGARRLPGRPGDQTGGLARGTRGRAPLHDRDTVHRRRRAVRADATPQRRTQADAAATPTALGGVLAGATPSC